MRKTLSRKASLAAAVVSTTTLVGAGIFGVAAPAFATAAVPTISKLGLSSGSTLTATNLLVTGKNFTGTTGVDVVGTAVASFVVLNDTQIAIVTAATHAAGGGRVVVTNGTGPNVDTATDDFTYVAPYAGTATPTLALNPAGGTQFTVTLTTGAAGTTLAAFKLNKITATVGGLSAPVTWVDDTHIKLTAPAGAPSNTAPAVVVNHNGVPSATITPGAKYAAVITKLSKTSGPLAGGGTLTVTGKGFTGATAWKFGLTNLSVTATKVLSVANTATCTVTNDTTATCTIPAAPKDGGFGGGTSNDFSGSVTVSFTPASSAAYASTAGATYTYTDIV